MYAEHSDDDVARIVAALRPYLSEPRMLGSQLGAALRSAARSQGLEFQSRPFGGLRAFAEKHLAHLVTRVLDDPTAQDDEYDVLAGPARAAANEGTESQTWSPVTGDSSVFWTLYSNPKRTAKFAVADSDDFRYSCNDVSQPEGWTPVQKIRASDYVEFASHFLAQVAESERPELSAILTRETAGSFYRAWHQALKRSSDRDAVRKWEIFRVESVQQHLKQQLANSQLSETAASRVIADLGSSQALSRPASALLSRPSQLPRIAGFGQQDADELRAVISLALENLSLDQLRQIPIPIGAALNAMQRIRRRQ